MTAVDGLEEPYVPFVSDVIGRRNALDSLPGGRYVAEVQAVIRDVVETEGPVSPTRLAKLVAHAYGLSRVLDDRVAQINRAVPADLRRDPEEGFVWPGARDPLRWRGFRRTTGSLKERPLDDVALREIGNAMATIVENAMGITRDELAKETYRVFGGTRVTPTARERLDRAMDSWCGRGVSRWWPEWSSPAGKRLSWRILSLPRRCGSSTIRERSEEAAAHRPGGQLVARRQLELAEHRRHVGLDGLDRDEELLGDFLVLVPARDEPHDLALPRGQPVQLLVDLGDLARGCTEGVQHEPGEPRAEDRVPVGDPPDRRHEVVRR